MASRMRQWLFRLLDFEHYLLWLSRLYFISYRLGLLKKNPKYKYHHYIPSILREGDYVLDIGANLGYFTVLFAKKVGKAGRVLAVEPIEPILNVLRHHVSKYPQVTIFPYALGRKEKSVILKNDTRQRLGYIASGSHSVVNQGEDDCEEASDYFEAEMRRGSTLFENLNRLDFIKCDIEGHETVVIPELELLIKKFKPSMLIETKREKRKFLVDYLNGLGYRPLELQDGQLANATESSQDDLLFVHPDIRPGILPK